MEFKNWLKLTEVGTGTNAVAVFSRPAIGMVRRNEPIILGGREYKNNNNNKKKKP